MVDIWIAAAQQMMEMKSSCYIVHHDKFQSRS